MAVNFAALTDDDGSGATGTVLNAAWQEALETAINAELSATGVTYGTWTPSVGGSATYTTQVGIWMKAGRIVVAQARMTVNAIGTGTQTAISGLVHQSDEFFAGSVGLLVGSATNLTSVSCYTNSGTTGIYITGFTAAGASMVNPATVFTSGTAIILTVVYRTP